jgi:hypothetical protein
MFTEDALEDRDVRAFFKGRTIMVAPFLMMPMPLSGIAPDFVPPFPDDVVVEMMECIDGED